jgi:hypothetical protein
MLDHVFLSVTEIERSLDFYTAALAPLGITTRLDYDGNDGPQGIPICTDSERAAGSSSGFGGARPTAAPPTSDSWRTARLM